MVTGLGLASLPIPLGTLHSRFRADELGERTQFAREESLRRIALLAQERYDVVISRCSVFDWRRAIRGDYGQLTDRLGA